MVDEIRAWQAQGETLKEQLRARRATALAEVAAIDEALAALGEPSPKRGRTASASAPVAADAPAAGTGKVDKRIAALRELRPWFAAIPEKFRAVAEARADGLSVPEITSKLKLDAAQTQYLLSQAKMRLKAARESGGRQPPRAPAADGDEDPEPATEQIAANDNDQQPRPKALHGNDHVLAELHELAPYVGGLGAKARRVVDLRLEGLTSKEIAARLNAPIGSVSSALFDARASMRRAQRRDGDSQTEAPTDEEPSAEQSPVAAAPPWDRADPDEDLTDVAAGPTADHSFVHLWSPESGGTPACTLAYDPGARSTGDRSQVTCESCLKIEEPAPVGVDKRPPAWVLGWLSPEVRRAFEGVALEGLSCQTMAWTEDVTPNVISGRVNGARQKVGRLVRWEAERAAEGNPLSDRDREPPPAYRNLPDPLLTFLQRPSAAEMTRVPPPEDTLADESPSTPALERARRKLKTIGGRARGQTIAGRLSRAEIDAGEQITYPDDVDRPRTREACESMPRPCPFVSCGHHLYLDVNPETGALKLNFPHLEVWDMPETCSLDVADRGGVTREDLGAILNLTRERIRQIEVRGLEKIKDVADEELGIAPERGLSPLAELAESE